MGDEYTSKAETIREMLKAGDVMADNLIALANHAHDEGMQDHCDVLRSLVGSWREATSHARGS